MGNSKEEMNSFERDIKNSLFTTSFQKFEGISMDELDFDESNQLDDDNES